MADKILFERGRLQVPDAPIIPCIQGDGIGLISGQMPSWSLIRQLKRLMVASERLFGRKFWLGKKQQTRQVTGYRMKR